jgi:hypothetical protein
MVQILGLLVLMSQLKGTEECVIIVIEIICTSRFPVKFQRFPILILIPKLETMKKYYVNDRVQANGDHEVHVEDCRYLPFQQNRTYLGEFSNCKPAVVAAKSKHKQVNGCKTCCLECHTQ